MSEKIKISPKDWNKSEFYLEQDAKKGDYICLQDIGAFSTDYIKEQFDTKINEIANERITEKLIIEKKNWENEFRVSKEFTDLNHELLNTKKELNLINENHQQKIDSLNNLKKMEIDKAVQNESLNQEKKISELKTELNILLIKTNKDKESKEAIHQSEIDKFNTIIESQKNEIDRRENKNIKLIGEDFEKWIESEFDRHFPISDKSKLEKTTKPIGGTKPDFEFKVFGDNQEILGTATIEAKTETISGKTKNSSHYEKLDRDRNNLNSEYAILVSELEPENTFLIKKVPEYKNMFVIRPAYLMTFLSLIQYISYEKQGVKKLELKFKDKQEIQKEFEEMKSEILENSIKHINTKCNEINDEVSKIKKSADKIQEAINLVLERHLSTVKTKIENFRIESIKNRIEKIN